MEDKRRCASCSKRAGWPVYKPLSEFRKRSDQGTYDSYCKACRTAIGSTRYKRGAAKAPVVEGMIFPRQDRLYKGETGAVIETVRIPSRGW